MHDRAGIWSSKDQNSRSSYGYDPLLECNAWAGQLLLCANTPTMGRPTNRGPGCINVMTCVICENRHSTRATCPGTCRLYKHLHCQALAGYSPLLSLTHDACFLTTVLIVPDMRRHCTASPALLAWRCMNVCISNIPTLERAPLGNVQLSPSNII